MKSIIATAALVATTTASNLITRELTATLNATFDASQPYAQVVNRCSYPVYLWSIAKELGCSTVDSVVLKTGEKYHENFRTTVDGGVSIKLSKSDTCAGQDITQLEYKIVDNTEDYNGNFLDMSFVDCTDNIEECPGRTDGFYLRSGNQNGKYPSAVDNEHCPIFSVNNAEEAAAVSYINWNDPQTKYCAADANLLLYLCGGEAPGADDETPSASSSASTSSSTSSSASSSEIESSSAQPTSSSSSSEDAAPSTTEAAFVVAAAAAITEAPAAPVVKTEVVYVTEFVKARHAHGRRHQHFHA